jgi:spore coat protein U-like protein
VKSPRPTWRDRCALLACAALAALAAPAVHAAVTSCTVTATGLAFGTYTPLQATALVSTNTIAIKCTGVTGNNAIFIQLSTGLSGNYGTRTLMSGAATLSYNLYANAADTFIWGNGTGVSYEVETFITTGVPTANLTVYGAVASGQDPAPGTYSDNITVTVNY